MISIEKQDFLVLMECLDTICSEYSGAKEVQEKYFPVYDKYEQLYRDLRKE